MANSINFTGRLGKDPELKEVGDYKVLKLAVANNVGFGDKKVTNWFNCDIWGTRGEKVKDYLSKGSDVFIIGELTLQKYTDNDGNERLSPNVNVTSLDFVGSKSDNNGSGDAPAQAPSSPESDEDLPF